MLIFTVGNGPALEATEYADFDTGQAVYRVTGIGAFTLGWDSDHHPEADQDSMEETLQVAYGTGPLGFRMDEAPVLYGVTLAGTESFTRAPLDAGALQLHPNRLIISAPVRALRGTARRASAIVSTLARHWLAQPWTAELRRAHEHHCAPHSLNRYGGLIGKYEERVRRLREHHAYYIQRADRATAILQACPVPAATGAPPHPSATAETAGR
ncbi:hypothetical protein RKE30_33595 [Streptomyces sp. Li-HN-5-11]|uniref:hypothetical protein n=1 Tax=Streptomyces sp. Li-HN-5-11 TaxID=3075432 RepID=UPI0028B16A05|nr:hypothetical protein [Streptomyces sp. Li-HN-5-11]WNM34958.1 hypothetical protein RKE30_33595 [Streptomyces sp. Li-HN-5-11]